MIRPATLRTDPLLLVFLLLASALAYLGAPKTQVAPPAPPPVIAAPVVPPPVGQLKFEQSFFDFGMVTEGAVVEHVFKFKNLGTGALKIVKTATSCGCTTTSGALKEYAAGEAGEFTVVVDTRGKKGIVVKTVTLSLENDPQKTLELTLVMTLQPPVHPPLGTPRNINTEAGCKSCHLESGQGQTGLFLYHRVCAQCHGKKGTGGSARAFDEAEWQQKMDDGTLAKWIRSGEPAKGMPSFVDGVTPPLSDAQVNSLVAYLRTINQ